MESGRRAALDRGALDRACEAAMGIEDAPLTGLALVIVSDGKLVYEGCLGSRRMAARLSVSGPVAGLGEADLPFDSATRLRVASMSKPVTALGLMCLVERGIFDLDSDVSGYLGFRLRNPHFPDSPITTRMLLAHISSLRDAGFYYPPLGHGIVELFDPEGRYYADGAHFARPKEDSSKEDVDLSPGHFYSYCNLGFGLIGTMIEKVTGKRFDLYMDEEIFKPLGIDGGFNPALLGDEGYNGLSPIYQQDPAGTWVAQIDDYPGQRPSEFVRRELLSGARLEDYRPGTNGTLFSPQGGMRISARDMGRIALVFLGGGEAPAQAAGGREGAPRPACRVVSAATIAGMAAPVWRRGASAMGAEPGSDHVLATGLGLMLTAGPFGRPGLLGHHGSAYGFLGGMHLDFVRKAGYVYMIGGTSRDPEKYRRLGSGLSFWEEGLREAAEKVIDWL